MLERGPFATSANRSLHVVMAAAHAGWNSEKVPVGGAGAVCERLAEAWQGQVDVTVLGSGPHAPPGVSYVRFPAGEGRSPTTLSEFEYARFCRAFERRVTDFILSVRHGDPPVVFSHDISEGPDFAALDAAAIPCACLVHVDVVEFFTRMYMHGVISAPHAARLHAALRRLPVIPDPLRLVFDKQADAVAHCDRLVVPSPRMKTVLEHCYPEMPRDRIDVVAWGSPEVAFAPEEVAREHDELSAEWGLRGAEKVVMTLSRISPEKGQDLLLQAIAAGEARGEVDRDTCLVICGEAAFMGGDRFMRRLRDRSRRLRTRVIFAGHLAGARKRAALERAWVFVSASRHESYGLTTMEAFAAGAPAVAVETHGSAATVDPSCGVLVPAGPKDAERLWVALRTVLDDPGLRERLSQGARLRAQRETFTLAADRLLALAHGLAGRAPSPVPDDASS